MALQDDFKKYFEAVQPGQVVEVPGGGTVTRNADGTATFSNGQYSYNYGANTSTDEVAKNVPALAAQWAQTYGTPAPAAPFNSLDEYKQWEAANVQNGPAQMAAGYEVPDYIRQMGLSRAAGDDGAFKRFLFFKNNPQYAQDYANIHNGQVSRFASDGSTLQRTDMSTLTPEAQALYGSNPGALAMAEGFNFDPNLYASRMNSVAPANNRTNSASYLQQNAMDAQGNITASNNSAKASEWARNNPHYKVNAYDRVTGGLLDNGIIYDAVSGQPIFASSNQDRLAAELSQQGIGGDSTVAHLTPGEVVVPREVIEANPELKRLIEAQAKRMGIDTSRTTVGAGNVINPRTGLPMFATQADADAYNAWIQTPGAQEYQSWVQSGGASGGSSTSGGASSGAATGGVTPTAYDSSGGSTGGTMPTAWDASSSTPKIMDGGVNTYSGSASGGGSSSGGSYSTDYTKDIQDIFRNSFGRDANQNGLDYWNKMAQERGGLDKIYDDLIYAGKGVGEKIKPLDYASAIADYQGPQGGATGNTTVDEWFYNLLGREPTDAERQKYQPALEYRLQTGGPEMANTIYTMFLRDNGLDPSKAIDWITASQLYGTKKPPKPPGTDGRPTTGIGLDQIQGPSMWDIDADQTVAGQLSKILANDSPLMQQARARALQQMNSRGLTNSSIAQSAADSAMYDQAMQIAQQDAGTYAERGKYNTDSKNTFSRDNNAFVRDAFMADFNLEANNWLAEQNFNREYKMLDKSQQQELERMAVSNGYQSARDQYLNQWQKEAASQSNDWQKEAASQSNNWQKVILDIQQKHSLEMEKLRQQYNSNQSGSETDNAEKAQAKADLQNALSKFASDAFKLDTSSMDPDVADQAYNNLAQSYNAIIKIATQKLGWKFEDWDIDLRTKPAADEDSGGGGGGGWSDTSPGDSGA